MGAMACFKNHLTTGPPLGSCPLKNFDGLLENMKIWLLGRAAQNQILEKLATRRKRTTSGQYPQAKKVV